MCPFYVVHDRRSVKDYELEDVREGVCDMHSLTGCGTCARRLKIEIGRGNVFLEKNSRGVGHDLADHLDKISFADLEKECTIPFTQSM